MSESIEIECDVVGSDSAIFSNAIDSVTVTLYSGPDSIGDVCMPLDSVRRLRAWLAEWLTEHGHEADCRAGTTEARVNDPAALIEGEREWIRAKLPDLRDLAASEVCFSGGHERALAAMQVHDWLAAMLTD